MNPRCQTGENTTVPLRAGRSGQGRIKTGSTQSPAGRTSEADRRAEHAVNHRRAEHAVNQPYTANERLDQTISRDRGIGDVDQKSVAHSSLHKNMVEVDCNKGR